MKYNEIYIGKHAFGKKAKVLLKDKLRKEHCHIIGGTGTGKSKLMEYMIRQDIRNGKGLCLIDPHGSLYESVLKWVVAHDFDHRLVVIDPNEKDWSVGLNFLEYDSECFDAGQHIENVITEIGKARNENIFETAHVMLWLTKFLQLAALQGLTFAEIECLLDDNNKRLRYVLTERIENAPGLVSRLKASWNLYDSTPKTERSKTMKLPVWARVETFLATETMRNIVGQSKSTVDFYKAIEKGDIVLVNLSGKLSEREKKLLGAIIIDKIYQAATKRKPDQGKRFYVYIDEFGNFVSERIAKALDGLRKRRVSFVLAHQQLEQLSEDESKNYSKKLLASIMTNTTIKIAFRISRADAEAMALEMFAGFITGDEIKHEQKVTSFWPHKTREKSYTSGTSISKAEATGFMEATNQAMSQAEGKIFVPDQGFLGLDQLASHSVITGSASSRMSGSSRSEIRGYNSSEAEIEFPFYDLEPFDQIVSTTFYSIEEIKERYIQFLQNQEDRFFHMRILGQTDRLPVPVETPTVKPVDDILPSVLKNARLKSIKKYSKPVREIEQEGEERRRELLKLQGPYEEREIEDEELIFNQENYEPPEQ